jgi:RHS repeat-associated protein
MESIIKGYMQWRFDSCLPIWKLTGQVQQMYVDGQGYVDVVDLNNKTLYASPYLVYNEQGYSKHYYAGAERVSSRIGGGMMQAPLDPLSSPLEHLSEQENWETIANDLLTMLKRGITCTEFDVDRASMESQLFSIGQSATINDPEENWYIYHSDHLGSSSFLTDASGDPTQHLQYLPFGETFVEQRSVTSYYTPYTFSAKERDPETGYSYFGARYYSSDISVWLSVDPMADKYPYQSGYCYVGWRPIMVIDPNGMWEQDKDGNWVAKKHDNAWTLHKHAGISFDEAKILMKEQGFKFSADDKHVKVNIGDRVTVPGSGSSNSSSSESSLNDSSNPIYNYGKLPDDFLIKTSYSSNSNYGGVLSIANGAYAKGIGLMFDIGAVSDNKGDAAGYMTLGLLFGYGKSGGFGISGTNLSNVDDFFGFSSGALVPVPYLKNLGLEGYFDIEGGAVRDYYGTNYGGFGLNASVGKAAGVYFSYTLRLYPVDNATYFTRPCRR